jgi:hypothetical protein
LSGEERILPLGEEKERGEMGWGGGGREGEREREREREREGWERRKNEGSVKEKKESGKQEE